MQNHFELFQLPAQFALDMHALDAAYRDVQGKVHPDRFINASRAGKRVAVQWGARANEAEQIRKSPQKGAQYLCEINGVDLQTESNTAMPVSFLMQQMEWREALGDARAGKDADALDALDRQLRGERKALLAQVAAQLDGGDYVNAAQSVRALMFLDKFGEEVRFAYEAMEA